MTPEISYRQKIVIVIYQFMNKVLRSNVDSNSLQAFDRKLFTQLTIPKKGGGEEQ